MSHTHRRCAYFGSMLALLLSGCGQEDLSTGRTLESPAASEPEASSIDDFKQRHTPREVATSDVLAEAYSKLVAKSEVAKLSAASRLAQNQARAGAIGLSGAQQTAWNDLDIVSASRAKVDWDADGQAPAQIELGMNFAGRTGPEAHDEAVRRIGPIVESMFESAEDELVLREEQPYTIDVGFGDEPPLRGYRYRYDRVVGGRPVFGDWYTETFTTSEHDPNVWRLTISARWTRDLPLAERPPMSVSQGMAAVRIASGCGADRELGSPKLGYYRKGTTAELAYEVELADGDEPALYYVSAQTGAMLATHSLIAHDTPGDLKMHVSRAYDNTPTPRALPFANIYENYQFGTGVTGCGYPPNTNNQWMGQQSTLKGNTNYAGAYSNLLVFNPSDFAWVVDLKGPYVRDISPNFFILDYDTFPAGGSHTIPLQTTYGRGRRGQVFYLLNYGRNVYSTFGIAQSEPLGYTMFIQEQYINSVSEDCASPNNGFECCGGYSKLGCIYVDCEMGPTGGAIAERRFREVVQHEQNHTLRWHVTGSLCSPTSECQASVTSDGIECGCWEEGRADFAAIAMDRLEKSRPEYDPKRSYPGSFATSTDVYDAGSVWSAMYTHYMQLAGQFAIGDVNANLNQVDTSTRMVGNCTSGTDISTCPVNSFYRQLIANQQALSAPKWRNTQEISEVFHAHVTDANRAVAGNQAFPWADEMPNRFLNSPFVYTEEPFGARYYVTDGPSGGGTLRLDSIDDNDTVMYFARAGETYTIGTDNLAAGVDTMVEVFKITSTNEVSVAFNDDCAPPLRHSCVTFTAADTGLYRVRVNPYPWSGLTGPGATYRLFIDSSLDDYGDTTAAAAAVSADNILHSPQGRFNTGSDVDVFAVAVPTAPQTLTYLGCSPSGSFDVKVEVINPSDVVVDSFTRRQCNGGPRNFTVNTTEMWKLRVTSPEGMSGDYALRVGLSSSDIDINGAYVNAWIMSGTSTYGSRFGTTTDNDWYRIDATAGQYYSVETVALDAGVDTKIEVYAPSQTLYGLAAQGLIDALPDTSGQGLGHWMLSDSNGALRGVDSRAAFWAPISGQYYVRIVPEGTPTVGRYLVAFNDNAGANLPYPAYP